MPKVHSLSRKVLCVLRFTMKLGSLPPKVHFRLGFSVLVAAASSFYGMPLATSFPDAFLLKLLKPKQLLLLLLLFFFLLFFYSKPYEFQGPSSPRSFFLRSSSASRS